MRSSKEVSAATMDERDADKEDQGIHISEYCGSSRKTCFSWENVTLW